MRLSQILATALVTTALATTPRSAQAQGRASAETLFKEGRAAAGREDWATACVKFEESQKLDPAPGTLANLATCEERQGHVARALKYAKEALASLPPGDSRTPVVKKLVAELERRVAKLTIVLQSGAPKDSKVALDGAELESANLGTAVPVDPGQHSVSVTAPGRQSKNVDVTLAEGGTKSLTVEPGPEESGAGAAAPLATGAGESSVPTEGAPAKSTKSDTTTSSSTSPLRIAGFVIGGLGVASIVVGGITGSMVFAKKKTVEEHCDERKACDAEGLDAGEQGKTLATVSTITFAAGAGALATGVLFVLLGKPDARVTVAPTSAAGGPGATAFGRF